MNWLCIAVGHTKPSDLCLWNVPTTASPTGFAVHQSSCLIPKVLLQAKLIGSTEMITVGTEAPAELGFRAPAGKQGLSPVSTEMREKVVLFHWENWRSSHRTVKNKKDKIIEEFPPVSNICFPLGILRQVAFLRSETVLHTRAVMNNYRVGLSAYALHNKEPSFVSSYISRI